MLKKISKWIRCNIINHHDWTTDFEQRGNKPKEGLKTSEEIIQAFKDDCRMYCRDCEHESELNERLNKL